jgi:outer membrane protein assembly factor BamA
VLNGALRVNTDAMFSVRGYYTLEVGAFATPFGKRPIVVGARVRQEGFPQEDFYGVGPHSNMGDRTSYMREGLDTTGYVTFAPRTWLNIETSAGFLDMRVRAGKDKNFPSIEQRFDAASAPGLAADGDMLHAGVTIYADRRDDDFFPRAGGRYIGSVTAFHGIADFRDDFTRADIDLRQYFGVPGTTNHAIAIRGQFAFSGGAGDSTVPFYMLPRLGGSNTLRAYETSRFTDQHAMVFAAEYRYLMTPKLQLVGFAEAGQVASRVRAFDFPTFKTSYGAGVRYRIKGSAVVRVDFARGLEGNRWIVGFSPGF